VVLTKTVPSIAVIIDSSASIMPPSSNTSSFITLRQTVSVCSTPYPDWQSPSDSFYEALNLHPEWYKTSATNPDQYFEAYEAAAQWAKTILAIVPSPKLSASYNSARIAKRNFEDISGGTPEIKIINSESGGPGISILVLYLARMINQGSPVEYIETKLMQAVTQLRFIAVLPSLTHLKASGRVPWVTDLAAKAFNVKFIIELSNNRTKLLAVTRNMPTALNRLIKEIYPGRIHAPPLSIPIAIINTNNFDANTFLLGRLRGYDDEITFKEITVSAAVATHVGPGFIGIAFVDRTNPK
jgi:DegV family protein with EDD domain